MALLGCVLLGLLHVPPAARTGIDMVPVAIAGTTLKVARYEVTVSEWQMCVDDGGCPALKFAVRAPNATPMTDVSWLDAQRFIRWISARDGKSYRLPSLSEWQIVRGKDFQPPQKPRFNDPRLAWAAYYGLEESPGGPVKPQGFWPKKSQPVSDLEGNVWEWTSTCAFGDNMLQDFDHCPAFHAGGTHDAVLSLFVRDPATGGCALGKPPAHLGFRLVLEEPEQPPV